jgi:hypothetical protein
MRSPDPLSLHSGSVAHWQKPGALTEPELPSNFAHVLALVGQSAELVQLGTHHSSTG